MPNKNRLPALAWLNVVVSRVAVLPTQRAMGFTPWDHGQYTGKKLRRPGGKWYYFVKDYGDGFFHPLDLPKELPRLLWHYRDLWPAWATQHHASEAVHGVVIHTKMTALLDLLWAVKYCQEAYRKFPRKSAQRNDIVEMLAKLFPPSLIPTTVTPQLFAELLITKKFKVFYVNQDGVVKDVSSLDPGSEDEDISNFAQLAGLVDQAGKIVSTCVNLYLDR